MTTTCWRRYGLKAPLGRLFDTSCMRILITGGVGFVGGRLAIHLCNLGHDVILGSRRVLLSPNWLPCAEVFQIDWDDHQSLSVACRGVDAVVHCAGMNAQDCALSPSAALEVNGHYTARLGMAAAEAGVKHFIYLSTAHVYASPLVGLVDENTSTNNPHPYASSHLAGENAIVDLAKDGNMQGTVLRLSNAFGAPVHPAMNCWPLLVNDLCRQAVKTSKIQLLTSGSQQRNFIPLSNVCETIGQMLGSEKVGAWGVFNLGSNKSHSVIDMAKLVQHRCQQVLGFRPALQYPEPVINELHLPLAYFSRRLMDIFPGMFFDFESEIDNLLHFCSEYFDNTQGIAR